VMMVVIMVVVVDVNRQRADVGGKGLVCEGRQVAQR
jgi:hypothetical protein